MKFQKINLGSVYGRFVLPVLSAVELKGVGKNRVNLATLNIVFYKDSG